MWCISFMLSLLQFPSLTRNVAIVGHLHHGKTALMDMLVFETHRLTWDSDKQVRRHLLLSLHVTFSLY